MNNPPTYPSKENSSAKVAGHASNHIFLRGLFLDVSRESIAKHFSFPTIESNSEYNQVLTRLSNQDPPVDVLEMIKQAICPGCAWIASKTNPRHAISTTPWTHHQKLVVKFVTSRLYPTSKSSEISIALLTIVYAILHNIPIDAAIAFLKKPSPNLIFPHMITNMAKTIGVNKMDGDILAYKNPPPLVEMSNLARHGAYHQPQHQAPPPHRQPNRAARSILEHVYASALASQQDWFIDNRRAMLSMRAIKDKEARQRNISTAHLPNISEQPYEYDPMVQQYIREFSQPFVGGESSTRYDVGGVGQRGAEGLGGGNDFDDLDMMDVLGTDLDAEIRDGNGTETMESRQPRHGKGKGFATSFPDTRFTEGDPSETDDDLT